MCFQFAHRRSTERVFAARDYRKPPLRKEDNIYSVFQKAFAQFPTNSIGFVRIFLLRRRTVDAAGGAMVALNGAASRRYVSTVDIFQHAKIGGFGAKKRRF